MQGRCPGVNESHSRAVQSPQRSIGLLVTANLSAASWGPVSRAITAGIWVAFFQRVLAIMVRTGRHGAAPWWRRSSRSGDRRRG